jgi:hypothetical protein
VPEHDAPAPTEGNRLAWLAWSLLNPDCRTITFSGWGTFDWKQVETVLSFYDIRMTPRLHRQLRVCVMEALTIEQERRQHE